VQAGFHGFTASIPVALAHAGRPDPEIGAIVGVAAIVQIGGAIVGGALIDRFGTIRLLAVGALFYIVSAALIFIFGLGTDATPALLAARVLQGAGGGLTVPAVLAMAPSLVPVARRGTAIAFVGSGHNLTLILLPPLSLEVLRRFEITGVAVLVAAMVLVALILALVRPFTLRAAEESNLGTAQRHFGFAWRRSWFAPLALVVLWVLHWGVVVAYLPQRAEAAGADIGLFFAADGVGVLLARIPAGWVADRIAPVWPVVGGILMTFAAIALLFDVPTTGALIVSGALSGVGAALIVQPLMLSLTARSTDRDRGSVFALFNASFSLAIALGTMGTAPLIASVGFGTLLAASLGALAASAVVAVLDKELRRPASVDEATAAVELAGEANAIGP
jgi:predicted MFS family arabinose efflux permease